ncbi:uncharacterized protein LOC107027231 isoform X3 [Solanum pennellii]|uniref:Uncharacterized protein LOC107027231 isoform X3 n=1 Tax=Solanum pennellii TaxID=28526 RepID=A0ABM1VFS3_SOLPN|nr:uncharacterized protein LOC107027231 isoform X3 [Solanum pennellii]
MLQSFKIVAPVPHVKHIQSLTHQMAVQATTALSIFALEITMMINQRYKARGFGFQLKEVQLLVQSKERTMRLKVNDIRKESMRNAILKGIHLIYAF